MKQYKVIKNEQIADGAYVLSFIRDFKFHAGQVVKLTLNKTLAPRMYSICSGTSEELVQLLYSIRHEGELTPKLSEIKAGDSILVSAPVGDFSSTNEAACWIAAGTGIAPFVSILKSGNKKDKMLIHGARHQKGFYFSEYIKSQLNSNYIQCCSGNFLENTFNGRVTEYVRNIMNIELFQKYYICGSAEMVVETRDILISRGIPYQQILSEIYF